MYGPTLLDFPFLYFLSFILFYFLLFFLSLRQHTNLLQCVKELRDKAERFKKTGFVTTHDAELTVVKSDTAISDELLAGLREHVAKLEDVPEHKKDWHPGTDKQVLDLLHPSLFPVVFGLTRALKTGTVPLEDCIAYTGRGEVTGDGKLEDFEWGIDVGQKHDLYQWLPSDVKLSEDGSAKITSYINNLHPRDHKELYGVLEKFVAASVPLWEEALTPYGDRRRFPLANTDDDEDFIIPEGIVYQIPRADGNGFHGDGEGDADSTGEPEDDDWQYEQEYYDWKEQHRILQFPEPADFVPFDEQTKEVERVHLKPSADTPSKFPEGLQVIFKLANIHLTPEDPTYEGGSWHIEGTLSEHICATALYYYDEENITTSRLSFRQGIDEEELMMIPAQGAFASLEAYIGVEQEGVAVQDVGSVVTRQGRLLAFPNILQHRVGSFELKDKTKPGHRKILAMFLVDPHFRILSSANVPPQRKDWWSEHVHNTNALSRLPTELFTQVIDMVDDFPMSWEQALEVREKLMEKRSAFVEEQEGVINEVSVTHLPFPPTKDEKI